MLELQMNKLAPVVVDWNFEALKSDLANMTEQYKGLVVTDDNLEDMEKVHREVVGLRTKITKFKSKVKAELDAPYKKFDAQIKELLAVVDSVESPMVGQLNKYEHERREKKAKGIRQYIDRKADEIGLDRRYSDEVVVADKWLNRTQKWTDTENDILMKIAWYLDIQKQDRDRAAFRAEKIEMAKFMCEKLSAGLVTPLAFAEIESRVDNFDLAGLRSHIEGIVEQRKAREEAAQKAVQEKAAEAKAENAPAALSAPASEVQNEIRCNLVFAVENVNKQQYDMIKSFLNLHGIKHSVAKAREEVA